MPLALLITGATGNQGSAVINALLAQELDVEILAVTRNPHSSAARRLTQKSPKIKLIQGDLDHPAQIFENAKKAATLPISGVFSVQVDLPSTSQHFPCPPAPPHPHNCHFIQDNTLYIQYCIFTQVKHV